MTSKKTPLFCRAQRDALDRRVSSGAAAGDEAQPPTPLTYNAPAAYLLVELKVRQTSSRPCWLGCCQVRTLHLAGCFVLG